MEVSNKNKELEKKIKLILSQTNYNKEEALLKLKEFDNNEINVIKNYLGIVIEEKSNNNLCNEFGFSTKRQLKSINQEIYKQIRLSLDNSMTHYREKNPINIEKVVENFKEEENNRKNSPNSPKRI